MKTAIIIAMIAMAGLSNVLGGLVYTQDFINPGSDTDLSSAGWSALGNEDTSNTNVDASAYTGTIGIAGSDYGFFAPQLGSLDNDALLVYTTDARVHVAVTSIAEVAYSYSGDPVDAVYRVAVQVGGVWYAQAAGTVDTRNNPGNGSFLSTTFSPPDFATATNWVTVSNAAVGAGPMALDAPPANDLSGTITAIGLFLGATLTEDHIRFDTFRVLNASEVSHPDPIVKAMLKAKAFQEQSGALPFDWLSGTFYSGVAACYKATGEREFLDAARNWCASGGWSLSARIPLNADAVCTAQTFLDVYFYDQDTNQIRQINGIFETYYFGQNTIDRDLLGNANWTGTTAPFTGRNLWWWCDALYMAPPLMARLGKATGDPQYYELLHTLYWDTVAYLYDPAEQLFSRDKRFFNSKTPLGQPVFWGRGNGWVIGGLVRTIDYIPADDPMRPKYIKLFQNMMGRIVSLQGEDGLWRSSLNEPSWFAMKESSGSSFFCFGLAAGINRGWLDRENYYPHMIQAWEGLLEILSPEGKVQWSQPVAAQPGAATQEYTRSYTQGAFMLAASEVYKTERKLGNVIYNQNFTTQGSDTDLSSAGWSALGNEDTSNTNVDASAYTGTIGIASSDYGFFAPQLGSLDNDALLVYTTNQSIHVGIASITKVGYSYSGDPTDAVYRVAVQVSGVWYAQATGTADTRDNPGNGSFLSTTFAPPNFATATNWMTVSNTAVGADPMALGAVPGSDLVGTVTAIGLFIGATLTEDHLRFDDFFVVAVPEPATIPKLGLRILLTLNNL